MDYNKTLNLPQTDFPMRAGLPQMEPVLLKKWDDTNLYSKMIENNKGKPAFVFHDGPPYANAAIHLGTALNKVLKDFVVRQKNMSGFCTPYIPGWDTHGLPIELRAMKEHNLKLNADPIVLRQKCHEFALEHVETQKSQFKRLGTLADYENPYLTLHTAFEAKQIEIFGSMVQKGYIYKDLRPVHWCPKCVTALAEAEIEYSDDPCDSVYVKFPIIEDTNGVLAKFGIEDLKNVFALIWTTTIWTLPANMAISLGPDFEYNIVKVNGEYIIVAKELTESVMLTAKLSDYEVVGVLTGKELEHTKYRHIFLERISPLIVGNHVTLESGTGLVHTAPGHGMDDFDVVKNNYPEIDIIVPVNKYGKMTEEAGEFIANKTTEQANGIIFEKIKEKGLLFAVEHIVHQYPHCWRCNSPILFRATEQWFCSVESFREQTLKVLENVEFIPSWGKLRLSNMIESRSAWGISRQRVWGVPIPVFYCEDCEKPIMTDESINTVSELFGREGSDAWFLKSAEDILPKGFACPHCNSTKGFTKETDIMDVWFDSGTSHAVVLEREGMSRPADLYMEGADQYRGWFQSSLLTSVAWKGDSPYKTVSTHGWVVDGEGRKQSKSLGNGVAPEDIIDKLGADILRVWVASSDYHADIRVSDDILKQASESYRKIRNTARFILGNINDFDPNTDKVDVQELNELDLWALAKVNELLTTCKKAYDDLDFYVVYHSILKFCTVDMSNFYLDIIKDRLYAEKADSYARRAAQTAIYEVLRSLTLLMAPIVSFTADEIWSYMAHETGDNTDNVVLNEIPDSKKLVKTSFVEKWAKIANIRDEVNKALEIARNGKLIGKSLEATVELYCEDELYSWLKEDTEMLKTVFIVSGISLQQDGIGNYVSEIEGLSITVLAAQGEKCERCWVINKTVGKDSEHPTLCSRCAEIVR